MIPNRQRSDDWTATEGEAQWGTGWDFIAGGDLEGPTPVPAEGHQLGLDLLGFLSDFRTAQQEEANRVQEAAAAGKRAALPVRRGLNPTLASPAEKAEIAAEIYDPYAGSEAQISPEWWLASDGRWYPPELHPDVQVRPEPQVAAPVVSEEVAAARPAEPFSKLRLLGAWPRLGMFHSPGTAAL